MKSEDIKKIAVIGAGDMGHGIAEVALLTGYKVAMSDIKQEFVDRGFNRIKESLSKFVEKQKITADAEKAMLSSMEIFTDLEKAVKDVDFAIEAAPEILDLKKKIFTDIDKFSPKHSVLASNTSNMSITEIAAATGRPDKVVGMHFFNPAVLMKLVEYIKGDKTSEETMEVTRDLISKMGKVPVRVEKDSPGFIYNRVNAPTMIYLGKLLEKHGMAAAEGVDAKMRKLGMPMGPYEIMDYTGIDVGYHSALYYANRVSPDYKPANWWKDLVDTNKLGKKTGQGIFDWSKGRPAIDQSKEMADFDPTDMAAIQVNEATKLLELGVSKSMDDIDTAMVNGGGSAVGPFQMAKMIGYEKIVKKLEELAQEYKTDEFKPTKTLVKLSQENKC
jgi:enoyl-CoA hydratase/3-hydroxyacyl-CoA dehydrogenase